jgi:amidase
MAITIQLFAVQGPMARHARDLRLALNAMCGPDPRDPNWVPAPLQGPALPQPLKVAVTTDPGGRGVDPAVAAGIKQAAQALSEAGYAVEEVDPPLVVEALELWANLVLCEIHNRVLPMIEPLASVDALTFLDHVSSLYPSWDLPAYIDGLAERNRIAREWSLFQAQYPLVLGPISTSPPFAVGHDIAGQEQVGEIVNSLRLVTTVNLLGLPATATPVQVVDGLPQGVQIIGPRYREDLCLDAAEAIEQKVGVPTPIDPKG